MQILYPKGLDFPALTPERRDRNGIEKGKGVNADDILYILNELEIKVGVDDSEDTLSIDYRLSSLEDSQGLALGTSNQVAAMNNAATQKVYKTLNGYSNQLSIIHTDIDITFKFASRVFLTPGGTDSAPGLTGAFFAVPEATYIDNSTGAGSTTTYAAFNAFSQPKLDGNEATETYYGANVYIAGKPLDTSSSARMWLHNGYALWVDADNVRLDGKLMLGGDVLDRTPSYSISFNDDAAKTIGVERTTTAATAGRALTINAGGAYSGGTNLAGGTLTFSAGTSTGTGTSTINFQTSTAGGSGTADNTPTTKLSIAGNTMTVSSSTQFNGQALIGSTNWGISTYIYVRSGAVNNHVCSMRYDSTYHLDWSEKEMLVYNNHFQIQTATAHDVVIQTNGASDRLRIYSAGNAKFFGDLTVQNVTFDDAKNMVFNTTTGTKIGTGTTQKLAFYNATPIVQRSGAAQAAVSTTGATNSSPYGYTTAAQADAIVTLVNELRASAVALGLIKGSA